MKLDHEDPNNHVPKISPEDNWDDLDSGSLASGSNMPPRRTDYGIPAKKENRQLHVRRHEPRLKIGEEEDTAIDPSDESARIAAKNPSRRFAKKAGGGRPTETAKKAAEKAGEKAGEKVAEKVAKKAVKKSPRKIAQKKATARISEGKNELTEDRSEKKVHSDKEKKGGGTHIVTQLPPAPKARASRIQVNRIGSADTSLEKVQRMSKMTPRLEGENEEKKKQEKQEKGRQRRRFVRGERSDWGEDGGRGSLMWMLFSGIGIVLIVILAVFLSQKGGSGRTGGSANSFVEQSDEFKGELRESKADLEMLEKLTNSQVKARGLYGKFATAKSISDFSDILYHRERNFPEVEKHWEPSDTIEGWVPGDTSGWRVIDQDGDRYALLEGSKNDFTSFTAFFRLEDGELKLDWKATIGFSSASFEDLKDGKGDGREIRAWISQSDFYTYPVPEEKFRSYRLLSHGGSHTIWAYTELGSELDEKLAKLFIPSQITGEVQSEVQITLGLEPGPEESLGNQWLISDIKGFNWLAK